MSQQLTPWQQILCDRAKNLIEEKLAGDSSGHDPAHVDRVCNLARRIADEEGADSFVVELAARLHDIADWKFAGGDDEAGPREADAWMQSQEIPAETRMQVCQIIRELSFKGAGVATPMSSLEGQCVQDADRLDAIGAVGIGRAFAFGGHRGRAMYDPATPPELHGSFAAYKKNAGPTINHFYEKLLLLRDRMNTRAAKAIAEERHAFMEEFLARFLAEWKGER